MRLIVIVLSSWLSLAASMALAQAVTDAQIAAIVVTANEVDVEAGRLAAARGNSPNVRAFGELMVNDHSGVNKAAGELVTRLGVRPEESPTSTGLRTSGEENRARLGSLTGTEFDRAYLDHEIAYHRQVLQALDEILIPGATNDELEALLQRVRPAFVAHLERARTIRSSLDSE